MGHLDGGHEHDVRVTEHFSHIIFLFFSHHTQTLVLDQSSEQNPTATLASLHSHIFVREDIYTYNKKLRTAIHPTPL